LTGNGDDGFYEAIPLLAARTTAQPLWTFLTTLLANKDSPGLRLIQTINPSINTKTAITDLNIKKGGVL
jgi:hypothetical protein